MLQQDPDRLKLDMLQLEAKRLKQLCNQEEEIMQKIHNRIIRIALVLMLLFLGIIASLVYSATN